MLYIASVGSSSGRQKISNEDLCSINPELNSKVLEELGVKTRYSCFPLEVLAADSTPRQRDEKALCSPTDLGKQAVDSALKGTAISPEQFGLVLGYCHSPHQLAPSEGQRIADKLKLKIPSFDVGSSGADLLLHIYTLLSWKEEVVPEVSLCVAANSPTRHINYSEGIAGVLLSDQAAALVITKNLDYSPLFKVVECSYGLKNSFSYTEIPIYEHLSFSYPVPSAVIEEEVSFISSIKEKYKSQFSNFYYASSLPIPSLILEIAKKSNTQPLIEGLINEGCSLSTTPFSALYFELAKLQSNDGVILTSSGLGEKKGYTVLERL
ncbi:MAG: hypothetical protein D6780_00055 [Candidatus Dadabacteria bacterium]|nr:MAG: hypothetical protein D6780_00055 [Candidatus Dadabacteria bacterium]